MARKGWREGYRSLNRPSATQSLLECQCKEKFQGKGTKLNSKNLKCRIQEQYLTDINMQMTKEWKLELGVSTFEHQL